MSERIHRDMIGKLIANLFRCPQSELGIIVKRSIVSDATVDRIVVRDIFKAPEHADLRAAIDPILMRMHAMQAAFSDFAGYFIREQLQR